jgi:DNA polymerase-3 subunit epsilon
VTDDRRVTLTPGLRIAFSGHFLLARSELVARAVQGGLVVEEHVDESTDVLVSNDAGSGSAKVRAAITEGVTILDEYTFEALVA